MLKGPAAILYGAVEPGGIVNLNTKQPLDHPAYSIQQQIGSYASYRTILDATGPVTQDKSLLYRFVGSYENDGSFRQFDYSKNWMVNPTFRWNFDADTWIRVSEQYQRNNLNQDRYFIPYYNNVIPLWLGRSFNFGPKSPYTQEQNFTELTWHHDFNKDWSISRPPSCSFCGTTGRILAEAPPSRTASQINFTSVLAIHDQIRFC